MTSKTNVSLLELEVLFWQLMRDNRRPNSRSQRQVRRLMDRCETTRRVTTADMGVDAQDFDEFPVEEQERRDLIQALQEVEAQLAPPPAPMTPPRQIVRGNAVRPPPLRRQTTMWEVRQQSSSVGSDTESIDSSDDDYLDHPVWSRPAKKSRRN